MSIKGKLPFIEYVAQSMSENELDAFKYELNNQTALTQIGFSDLENNLVDSVVFKFSENDYKQGIIIKNENICVLFVFYEDQEISIFDIDLTNNTYKQIKEYCTIFELRAVLFGIVAVRKITPAELLENIEGSNDVVVDLNESDDKVQVRLDKDVIDLIKFTKLNIEDITHEISQGNTIIVLNNELFNSDSCYEIVLEIEGEGSHYGTKCIAFPYNNSQCFSSSNLYMAEETDNKVITTMDEDGQINITILDYEMTPQSQTTTIHVKKLF